MAACTVDPGPDTGPPQTCTKQPAYFVSTAWPQYFDRYQCGQSNCHDASSGHGYFRLQDVSAVVAPQPTDPVALWPMQWSDNLRAVEHNMSCSSPLTSAVLAVPEGNAQPHPPGDVIGDHVAAEMLFEMWP
jgi:hypothetical protein